MDHILMGRPLYTTILLIFVYSITGWLLEVIYAYYQRGHFVNRGFLYGPFCPIYGLSITAIVTVLKPVEESVLLLFFSSVAITTAAEYITSFILERIFDSKWWDYSSNKFNLNGRICLSFSLIWGIAGVFVYRVVNPFVESVIYSMPEKTAITLSYIVLVVFLLDITMTVVSLAGLRSYIYKLQSLAYKAKNLTGSKLERVAKIKEFLAIYGELEVKLKFNQRRLLKSFPDFKKNRFGKLVKELKCEIEKFREEFKED